MAGVASRILLKAGVDVPAVVVKGTTGAYAQVRDLHVTSVGPHTVNRHGIAVQSSGSTPYTGNDAYMLIMNVLVTNMGGHGVAIGINPSGGTADVREFRCINVICVDCSRAAVDAAAGFYVNGTDGELIGCTAAGVDGPGYHVTKANNRLDNCKGFYNRGEFIITGNRNQLSNCQAQDGFGNGFQLGSTGGTLSNTSLSGCQADSNTGAALKMTNVAASSIVGLTAFYRSGAPTPVGDGVSLTGVTASLITGIVTGLNNRLTGTNDDGVTQLVGGRNHQSSGDLCLLPVPVRIYDSRPGTLPATGSKTPLINGTPRTLDCTWNSTGVPIGATGVLLSCLLVNAATAPGNFTVWAGGVAKPSSNTLVWGGADARYSTTAVSAISSTATIQVEASHTTDVVVDVIGYLAIK